MGLAKWTSLVPQIHQGSDFHPEAVFKACSFGVIRLMWVWLEIRRTLDTPMSHVHAYHTHVTLLGITGPQDANCLLGEWETSVTLLSVGVTAHQTQPAEGRPSEMPSLSDLQCLWAKKMWLDFAEQESLPWGDSSSEVVCPSSLTAEGAHHLTQHFWLIFGNQKRVL